MFVFLTTYFEMLCLGLQMWMSVKNTGMPCVAHGNARTPWAHITALWDVQLASIAHHLANALVGSMSVETLGHSKDKKKPLSWRTSADEGKERKVMTNMKAKASASFCLVVLSLSLGISLFLMQYKKPPFFFPY